MKMGKFSNLQVVIGGVVIGLLVGCLVTWYPIRLLFCAVYNTPDCEEIVLITFPFYCFIAPIIGGIIAHLIYRKQHNQE